MFDAHGISFLFIHLVIQDYIEMLSSKTAIERFEWLLKCEYRHETGRAGVLDSRAGIVSYQFMQIK